MSKVSIRVNGRLHSHDIEARTHLGDFLRDSVRLTGTHLGCEHGVCGACTVLIDGEPVRSCITFAVACEGREVTTVEGYDADPLMSRLRSAFHAHHALQCGYCTPGMLATTRDLVLRLPEADEARVRFELAGNLCRCTGYMGIVAAVLDVLDQCRRERDPAIEALRADACARRSGGSPAPAGVATAFAPFEPAAVLSAPSEPSEPTGAGSGVADSVTAGKGAHIDGRFEVPFPADRVWSFMGDLPAVAACLPGASIDSQDGDRLKGRIAIRFGPMTAAFVGAARLERDEPARSAVLKGAGQDSLSQSRAQGDVGYRLEALPDGATRVHVDLVYSLQGPLAQFSRSGLVRDFVRRMIIDFGKNVGARLARTDDPRPGHPARASTQASTQAQAGLPPAAPLRPVRTMISILLDRLRRALGIGR